MQYELYIEFYLTCFFNFVVCYQVTFSHMCSKKIYINNISIFIHEFSCFKRKKSTIEFRFTKPYFLKNRHYLWSKIFEKLKDLQVQKCYFKFKSCYTLGSLDKIFILFNFLIFKQWRVHAIRIRDALKLILLF